MLDDVEIDTTGRLGSLLADVSRAWWQTVDRALDASNIALSTGEIRTLIQIAHEPPRSMRSLAARMGVKPMTVSDFVTRLEARGYVDRKPRADDKRAFRLTLTPAAEAVLQKIEPINRSVEEFAVRRLTHGEQHELERLLSIMRENFSSSAAEAPR